MTTRSVVSAMFTPGSFASPGPRPLYLWDLDGTLADISHRLHWISPERTKKDWKAFESNVSDDLPIVHNIQTMAALVRSGAECWIWTGRHHRTREATERWLAQHGAAGYTQLRMRGQDGESGSDVYVKGGWLAGMSPADRMRLRAAFEDRARVVAMYRAAGVAVYQVAEGNY